MNESKIGTVFSLLLMLFFFSNAHGQVGGTFTVTESVIASGGGQNATGGPFLLDDTVGQTIAGNAISGTPFTVTSGFWNFRPSVPTAASVSIGGQVRTANGRGIQNAVITITSPNTSTRIARSSTFGYYRFEGVAAGETYIVGISAKRFAFSKSTIVIGVFDEMTDLDFVAELLP